MSSDFCIDRLNLEPDCVDSSVRKVLVEFISFCFLFIEKCKLCIGVAVIDTFLNIASHHCHIRRIIRILTQNHARFDFFGFNHRLDLLSLFGPHVQCIVHSCTL